MSSLQAFKDSFQGIIATEGEPDYSVKRWADNASRNAKYVAYPRNAEDISKAIKFATSEKLDLAIRGGGHATSGASSSEGGLVIDLSKFLNGVRIDADKKLAHAQGGAIWETVDVEAIKYGLAACAGVVNDTGVGGLTTGGGFGYSIGKYGLVIDNLVSATVVVANGDILIANETQNPDLFWGIRGGGSNFGVVAEFTFKLHEQRRDVYTYKLIFPPSALPAIVSEVRDWLKTQRTDETIFVILAAGPDGSPIVFLSGYRNCDEAEGVESIKRFVALGPLMNMCEQVPYEKLNGLLNDLGPWGGNKVFRGTRIPAVTATEVMQDAWDARLKLVAEYPAAVNTCYIFEFYHLEKMAAVPPQTTALSDRRTDVNVLIDVIWADDSFTPFAREESRKLADSITKHAPELRRKGVGYSNFADTEALHASEDKTKALFGVNYPRLQQVKRKYDPDMVFNKWFPIVPAPGSAQDQVRSLSFNAGCMIPPKCSIL